MQMPWYDSTLKAICDGGKQKGTVKHPVKASWNRGIPVNNRGIT